MSKQIVADKKSFMGPSRLPDRERSLELEILALQAQINKLKNDRLKHLEEQEDKADSDLLPRLVLGGGMTRSQPGIRCGQIANRAVFYGPYVRLKAGLYRLSCQITADGTLPLSASLGIGLEVIYRDVVVAREHFEKSTDGAYYVQFQINHFMSKVFNEALYEFRMSSNGTHAFFASNIHFSKNITEKVTSNSIEMIDICFPESRTIIKNKSVMAASETAAGHVFFGPYIHLAAGKYVFSAKVSTVSGSESQRNVKMDIQSAAGELGSREFTLQDGENELRLEFEVPPCDNYDALPSRIEFRLEKPAGFALTVTSIRALGPMV